MNQQTQQFMYKATVITVCGILGGAFLFMFGAALRLGDGEAVKIIDAMQTQVLGAFGALIAFVWGHQASAAVIAKAQAAAGAVPATDPAATVPAPAPAAVPMAAPQPAPTADPATITAATASGV